MPFYTGRQRRISASDCVSEVPYSNVDRITACPERDFEALPRLCLPLPNTRTSPRPICVTPAVQTLPLNVSELVFIALALQ